MFSPRGGDTRSVLWSRSKGTSSKEPLAAQGVCPPLDAAEMLDSTASWACPGRWMTGRFLLKRQNKIFFQINGVGHEAVLAAAAKVLRPGYDWSFPTTGTAPCASGSDDADGNVTRCRRRRG